MKPKPKKKTKTPKVIRGTVQIDISGWDIVNKVLSQVTHDINNYKARLRARLFFWFLIVCTLSACGFAAYEFVYAIGRSIERQAQTP